jgi:coenzyme F420 biosynthesis associated uncharacterized protein
MARLIEPWIARSVARRLTGDSGLAGSYLLDRLHRDLADAVPRAEELVAETSGIAPPPPVQWRIIDRAAWADANIRSMTALLGPLATKIEQRLDAAPLPVRVAQRTVVSAEVGALLGYVSRRVLGQYDLLLSGPPTEDEVEPRDSMLYFVGPNMVETERRFGFIPEEFALWVAVHEVTHRFQFDGVPWVRGRFFALMHDYLDAAEVDARGLARRLAEAASRFARRSLPPEERSPVYLLASPEQRSIMDRVQALMAVVEGHGNFVMDHVGERVIPSFKRMRGVFERRRRQTNLLQRAFHHAIGLELKLRQYELGKEFCDRVVAVAGMDALGELWTSEGSLPSLAELRAPEKWLARVA